MDASAGVDQKYVRELLLSDTLASIRESIKQSDVYDFSYDLRTRLESLEMSVSELARRCCVTHTIVKKWLTGAARPNGKERMKELGMACGMTTKELDEFLLANCYTKLYAKNPFDNVCELMINEYKDSDQIVMHYRAYVEKHHIRDLTLGQKRASIPTANISLSMDMVNNDTDFGRWIGKYQKYFAATDKGVVPSKDLVRFILLYVGDSTINKMYMTGEVPIVIRNLLYPLVNDKEVVLRGLRNKLIVFGLCNNMTEDEMDLMLNYARLRTFSQTRTALDIALLTDVRCAHERYPYYEYLSMDKRIASLNEILKHQKDCSQEDPFFTELSESFSAYHENASARVAYYDLPGKRGEEEKLFELCYTDHAGKRLVDYVCDVLTMLVDSGDVNKKEVGNIVRIIEEKTQTGKD